MERELKPMLPSSAKKNSQESIPSETDDLSQDGSNSHEDPSGKKHFAGFTLGVFACLTAALGMATAQGLQGAIPDWELAAWRLLAKTAYACAVLVFRQELPTVPKELVFYILIYSGMYTAYNFSIFASCNNMALGESTSIFTIIYMVCGTTLSFVFGLESVKMVKVVAIVICTVGALLVSQPAFLHIDHLHTGEPNSNSSGIKMSINGTIHESAFYMEVSDRCYTKGVVFAMLGGFACALFYFIQKKKLQDLSTHVLVFYACSVGGVLSWIISFIAEEVTLPHSTTNTLLLLGHCILSILPCIGVYAQRLTSVTIFSASQSSLLVFMFIGQYTLMKDIFPGHRNWFEILGAILITFGSSLVPFTALGETLLAKLREWFWPIDGTYQKISAEEEQTILSQ